MKFDDFCPVFSLRVGNGVGKKYSDSKRFLIYFLHPCGEERSFFITEFALQDKRDIKAWQVEKKLNIRACFIGKKFA
jgi:hypothetical protein